MLDTHYLWVSSIFVIIVISNKSGSWHLILLTHSQEFWGQQRNGDSPRSSKTCKGKVSKILIFFNSLVVCEYPHEPSIMVSPAEVPAYKRIIPAGFVDCLHSLWWGRKGYKSKIWQNHALVFHWDLRRRDRPLFMAPQMKKL